MRILLERDPEPKSTEPAFVKEAYDGLVLEASAFHEPKGKVHELFPYGFYEVPIQELLSRMREHNLLAYEWLAGMWGLSYVSLMNRGLTLGFR